MKKIPYLCRIMVLAIVKAFLIGICASIPLGPCAILVLQKSLSYGHRAGFVTALGATSCDTFWATLSIFALAAAERFIDANQTLIYILGGIVVGLLGFNMATKDPFRNSTNETKAKTFNITYYLQALATAMSNPAAVFVMLALFTFFNVETPDKTILILPLIAAVAAGSFCYWFCFTWVFSHLRRAFKKDTIVWINRGAGVIIAVLGTIALVKGVMLIK